MPIFGGGSPELNIPVSMDAGGAIKSADKLKDKIDDVGDAAQDTSKRGSKLGGMFDLLGKGALVAGGAVVGLGLGLFEMAKSAGEDEQSMERLMRTVRNSGAAYDGAGADVEAFISKQQKLAFADDEVRESLNLLVTQTGDLGEAMELQATAADLARFGNIDLEKATRLLLKADAESYAALGKLGIQIDDNATKEEALQQVRAATAGQAEQFASSTAGTLMRIQDSVGEAFETVGAAVLPLVEGPLKAFADWLQSPEVQTGITNLATWVGTTLTDAFNTLKGIIDAVWPIIQPFAQAFVDFFARIKDGQPFLDSLGDLFGDLGEAVSKAWDVVGPALGDLIGNILKWIVDNAPAILAKLGEWAIAFGTWVWQDAIPFLLEELGKLIVTVWDWIVENGPKILAELGKWAQAFWDWASGVARDLPGHLAPIAQALWDWMTGVDNELKPRMHTLATRFGEMPEDAKQQLEAPTGLPIVLLTIETWLAEATIRIGDLIFKEWVPALWNWVVDVVKGLPEKLEYIWLVLSTFITKLGPKILASAIMIGRNFVDGIIDGIKRGWDMLTNFVTAKINVLIANAKAALGIKSPSAVMAADVGEPIAEGIAQGFMRMFPTSLGLMIGTLSTTMTALDVWLMQNQPGIQGAGASMVDSLKEGWGHAFAALLTQIDADLMEARRRIAEGVTVGTTTVYNGSNGVPPGLGGGGLPGGNEGRHVLGSTSVFPNGSLAPPAALAHGGVVVQILVDGRAWSLQELSERLGLQIRLQTAGGV